MGIRKVNKLRFLLRMTKENNTEQQAIRLIAENLMIDVEQESLNQTIAETLNLLNKPPEKQPSADKKRQSS